MGSLYRRSISVETSYEMLEKNLKEKNREVLVRKMDPVISFALRTFTCASCCMRAVYTRHANSGCFTMFFPLHWTWAASTCQSIFYVSSSLCSYLSLLGRDGSGRVRKADPAGRVRSGRAKSGSAQHWVRGSCDKLTASAPQGIMSIYASL